MELNGPYSVVKTEEDDLVDSDVELEAALVVEDDPLSDGEISGDPLPGAKVEGDASAGGMKTQPQLFGSSSGSTLTPFKLPPNPTIPQDLSIIMEMVASNQVVGSLPPISMTAAERRRLVEASMQKNKGKAKEEVSDNTAGVQTETAGVKAEDLQSDSSSEFESSSEEESDAEQAKKEPLTAEQHEELKKELDQFVGASESMEVEAATDSEADSDSDDDDEDFSFPGLASMGYEFMEDDEDDVGGPAGGAAITSVHEAGLPPVALPPIEKLPEGEGVSLAGDVVSWMREKKVEAWLEKRAAEEEEEKKVAEGTEAVPESAQMGQGDTAPLADDKEGQTHEATASAVEAVTTTASPAKINSTQPKFTTSGTVVVRAMQSRPGAADEGWLEEGSVLCWEDGRVLGTVHETFGPLTSPFYTIRLPPPPFPYPAPESLASGKKLYYPLNPSYRSFVNMLAVRDPRFKGSDASNIYDEEIGEDEMEWSDDEAEAEAKKRRKQRRAGSKAPSVGPGTPRAGPGPAAGHHSLPARPHFDYQPTDEASASDAGSMYGGDDDRDRERWDEVSDVGSTASTRGRPKPAPYEVDGPQGLSQAYSGESAAHGRGRGGRGGAGRGQGRERGRGRGAGQSQGRGRGRGDGRSQGPGRSNPESTSAPTGRPAFPLPVNPLLHQQNFHAQHQHQQQQSYTHQPFQPSYPLPQQPFPQAYPQQGYPYHPANPYPQQQPYTPGGYSADGYEPHQPSMGMMPPYGQQLPSQAQPQPRPPPQQQQGGGPAINPRFAAQYQQMMMGQTQPGQPGMPPQSQGQAYGGWQSQHYSE
ncbi:hypothetical protein IAU60_005311 [Kwoniella sp. DSM 27419]